MIEDNPFLKIVGDFPSEFEFRDKVFDFTSYKLKEKVRRVKVKPKADISDDESVLDDDMSDSDSSFFENVEPEFLEKMREFRKRCSDIGRVDIRYNDFEEWERFLQSVFKSSFPEDFWYNLSAWVNVMGDLPRIESMIKKRNIPYNFDRIKKKFVRIS